MNNPYQPGDKVLVDVKWDGNYVEGVVTHAPYVDRFSVCSTFVSIPGVKLTWYANERIMPSTPIEGLAIRFRSQEID